MPMYLIAAKYTQQGVQGLLKEGGSSRRKAVEEMARSLGGRVESFYFAFGMSDVFVVVDMPDAATAASVSLTVNASGSVTTTTVPLLTIEEMDEATRKTVSYRAPGR